MPPRLFDGERVRRARRAADMTQRQLAEAIGVAEGTIPGWEHGTSEPDQERLPKIARALGKDLDAFFPRATSPDEPDLADLRRDAGYFQKQSASILGTKSARPVAAAENGQRRLTERFIEPLARAYGVSEEELRAAQERSFGNTVPPVTKAGSSPAPRTLAEKITYLLKHTYPGEQTPPSDAEIAQGINAYAGADVATGEMAEGLRTGRVTEASPIVRAGLAHVLGVEPLFFEPDSAVVRQVIEGLQLLARQGPESRIAARGMGEEGLPSDVLAKVNEIVAELQAQGIRGPSSSQ